jgi:hypothetical protein
MRRRRRPVPYRKRPDAEIAAESLRHLSEQERIEAMRPPMTPGEAQKILQRRGKVVYRASVAGGRADRWYVSAKGNQVTDAQLIAMAEKSRPSSRGPHELRPAHRGVASRRLRPAPEQLGAMALPPGRHARGLGFRIVGYAASREALLRQPRPHLHPIAPAALDDPRRRRPMPAAERP